ncbi:MAG: tRNA lysidine(34) synthetase TilS [Rickettsiales bacterium]|jgi:tRNA(Ile)-lysidine synthase|nr:tRNA lysidine(34) synthetase TilS [Rickettsiales bacterium]
MNTNFLDFVGQYNGAPVALAVSGGVDSIVMLHWYAMMGLPAIVLHVNHGLRTEADAEAEYVSAVAKKLNIPCYILEWKGDKPLAGLEAAARIARYNLMTEFCRENNIGILFTAHQADDNIETFLMNLARGSGVYGLGGIRAESVRDGITIARPLLNVFRRELKDWADTNNVKYTNDAMNYDDNFTRVKMRQNRKVLSECLGISDERILLAVANLARARDALEQIVIDKIPSEKDGRIIFSADMFFAMVDELQLKFLASALQKVGGAEYSPRLCEIQRLRNGLKNDKVLTLAGCTIRRFGSKILITKTGNSISFRDKK